VPRGKKPDPDLEIPFQPIPINPYVAVPWITDPAFPFKSPIPDVVPESPADEAELPKEELIAFGSSEYAKVILGSLWGRPPALDLDAEADLHTLLAVLANRKLLRSARDISDGGITVALAQAAFPLSVGAAVEQDPSLMVHPLFGLFAEQATTMLVSTHASNAATIESIAAEYSFLAARIGTTGGDRLEISVYGDTLISAPLDDLRKPWAAALESTLHGEVTA
jgi:phosphoribosylformylglycinamidine synthase